MKHLCGGVQYQKVLRAHTAAPCGRGWVAAGWAVLYGLDGRLSRGREPGLTDKWWGVGVGKLGDTVWPLAQGSSLIHNTLAPTPGAHALSRRLSLSRWSFFRGFLSFDLGGGGEK